MRLRIILQLIITLTLGKTQAQSIQIPIDTAQLDLRALARQFIPVRSPTTFENVRRIVQWTNSNFKWPYTDYQRRTINQIICRKRGNCNEKASAVSALMQEMGIKNRRVSEINIQPESDRRPESVAGMVKEVRIALVCIWSVSNMWLRGYPCAHNLTGR